MCPCVKVNGTFDAISSVMRLDTPVSAVSCTRTAVGLNVVIEDNVTIVYDVAQFGYNLKMWIQDHHEDGLRAVDVEASWCFCLST